MGRISGLDLCEEVRKRSPSTVPVLLTGYRNFEYARRAIHQNVFDYLVKPTTFADVDNLLTRLKTYLDGQRKKQAEADPSGLQYTGVVQQMQKLAREHFCEGFSLENAAERLSMNAAYLSRLFKQQCGQNYTDYLIALRM